MDETSFLEYWFWASWLILAVLIWKMFIKGMVYRKIYGSRWQYYHVIDTGESGYILFPPEMTSKVVNGCERVYNLERITGGTIFYEHSNAEPLCLEKNDKKYIWYCNSYEFKSVLHNTLIEKLLMTLMQDDIMFILKIMLIAICINIIMTWFKLNSIEQGLQAAAHNVSVAIEMAKNINATGGVQLGN